MMQSSIKYENADFQMHHRVLPVVRSSLELFARSLSYPILQQITA